METVDYNELNVFVNMWKVNSKDTWMTLIEVIWVSSWTNLHVQSKIQQSNQVFYVYSFEHVFVFLIPKLLQVCKVCGRQLLKNLK